MPKKNEKNNKHMNAGETTVAVIGLGYVGLPLACLCAEKGYTVVGLDTSPEKIEKINRGVSPIHDAELSDWLKVLKIHATSDPKVLKKAQIIIVCVPTPVDKYYNPDLGPVISAVRAIKDNLVSGQIIAIESTINPGVCEEVVLPILEQSGLKPGKDFHLVHCPERINPGDKQWNVRNIPRVLGGLSAKCRERGLEFYRSIIADEIRPMKSLKEAEATKIVENAFRDINIAFVNELAKSFDKLNIDLCDVIAGASTKPFAFLPHWPGAGVGGHCIPVDPYYLIERAKLNGFDHKFLKLAREINNSMPAYAVELLQTALNKIGKPIKGTKIGILGLSYKADVGDIRESPTIKVIELLKEMESDLEIYDPYFPDKSTTSSLEGLLKKCDVFVLMTNHHEFVAMDLSKLKEYGIKVVIDGKNCLDQERIRAMDIIYKGIGR